MLLSTGVVVSQVLLSTGVVVSQMLLSAGVVVSQVLLFTVYDLGVATVISMLKY